jgi:pimeloyl-ACP methyl ester carboxylesterase
VLVHAWLDSRRYFDQVMAVLPERIRAFAVDQRGHGDAAKPADGYGLRDFADDIGAFMDAVGLDAAVLAGASSGGYVAQRFAVDDPDRTLGLALLGSPRILRETPRTLRIGMPFRALGALALQESAHRRGMLSCCLCPVDNAPCRMLSSLRAHARRRRRELGVGSRCSRSSLRLSRFPRARSAQ